MFCEQCGAPQPPGSELCANCGFRFSPTPAASQETFAQPQAVPIVADSPLPENLAGVLAYLTIVPAILFLLIEPFKQNRFVRFHSFQCLFASVALIVLNIVLAIISSIFHLLPAIGWFLAVLVWPLFGLAVFALWLLLMVKAYQHEIYKLPYIGDLAEKQADG